MNLKEWYLCQMNQKLPVVLKLKSKKQIEHLFKQGKSIKAYPLLLIWNEVQMEVPFKVGFSVSKRNFKKAVDRNYIKRLLRENFRKNKYLFTEPEKQVLLMFIFIGKEKPGYQNIEKALRRIEDRWIKK